MPHFVRSGALCKKIEVTKYLLSPIGSRPLLNEDKFSFESRRSDRRTSITGVGQQTRILGEGRFNQSLRIRKVAP